MSIAVPDHDGDNLETYFDVLFEKVVGKIEALAAKECEDPEWAKVTGTLISIVHFILQQVCKLEQDAHELKKKVTLQTVSPHPCD